MTLTIVIFSIALALFFEFSNGFHDTANAVATSIATKALSPYQAILIAAIFNVIGALVSTNVAMTISKGLVDPHILGGIVLIATLISAIAWNLITWYFGIPSSSSHALIASLFGASWLYSGIDAVNFIDLWKKVIIPMMLSPLIGFITAFILMSVMSKLFAKNAEPRNTNNFIRELQVFSASFLAFSHGANDSQKTMAIITLSLFSYGLIDKVAVPIWVVLLCGFCMGLGTICGGMRIIKTLSTRVAKLKPVNGFAAEISSASIIFVGAMMGIPLSTTHATTGSIMGAGRTGKNTINWNTVKQVMLAWIITYPICMILAMLSLKILLLLKNL